jgi:hypothetical protein
MRRDGALSVIYPLDIKVQLTFRQGLCPPTVFNPRLGYKTSMLKTEWSREQAKSIEFFAMRLVLCGLNFSLPSTVAPLYVTCAMLSAPLRFSIRTFWEPQGREERTIPKDVLIVLL